MNGNVSVTPFIIIIKSFSSVIKLWTHGHIFVRSRTSGALPAVPELKKRTRYMQYAATTVCVFLNFFAKMRTFCLYTKIQETSGKIVSKFEKDGKVGKL
jgi:hypothetical protein